ncbi:MAG: response regulator transcription factor [Actinobacteria bacterium]|nr:response regulator transcription factor [Actinomycetota bacterium]
MSQIEVILADDHVLFRQGLARLLDLEPDIVVMAQASTGREVLERLKVQLPDLVIMDITMPDMDGVEATAQVTALYPQVKVLVLSAHEDRDALFAAIDAGAAGYLIKDTEPEELARAIRVVAAGGSIVSPSMTTQLLQGVREMGYDPAETERRRLSLSDRELEILRQLSTPKSPAQIGRELFISTKTVQNHISNIYRKLDVNSRTEAVIRAMDLGLTTRS